MFEKWKKKPSWNNKTLMRRQTNIGLQCMLNLAATTGAIILLPYQIVQFIVGY